MTDPAGSPPGDDSSGGARRGRRHAIWRDAAAGAQHAFSHPQDLRGKLGLAQLRNRLIEVIFHTAKLHLTIFDDDIRGPGISVAGLTDTARIDDLHFGEGEVHRRVGMPDAQEIGHEMRGAQLPGLGIVTEILVKRRAGCGMHQGESQAVEFHRGLDGEPGEEAHLPGIQPLPLQGPGGRHELTETPTVSRGHPLGDIVVVISPDGGVRVLPDPIDAGGGIDAVVDQVAGEETRIKRLLNGSQSRPIGMDVGQEQDSQEKQPERTRKRVAGLYKREAVGLTLIGFIISND